MNHRKQRGVKKEENQGGILLYCKTYLKPFIKILKSCLTHVWFEIDKDLFYNIPKRIRVCTLYCPPETSKYYPEDLWDDLKTEILELTTNDTPFLLIGDMNARTGEILEFSHLHTPNFNCSPTRYVIESNRKNCEKTNNQVTKLINLCKCFDMQIANGRFRGDCWGNYTHHKKNKGQSSVDMAVISDNLFPLMEDFKMYADDLIIFSATTDGLQKSLDSLSDYCGKWKLDINYTKTKCMTFTKGNTKEKK